MLEQYSNPVWELMRLAALSVARLCVFPIQDVLGLDSSARFNDPGDGLAPTNWSWRLSSIDDLSGEEFNKLHALTKLSGRSPNV